MKHIELKMLNGVAKHGNLSHPQSVNSREVGRPHDHSHVSGQAAKVRTGPEIAMAHLDRLGPCDDNMMESRTAAGGTEKLRLAHFGTLAMDTTDRSRQVRGCKRAQQSDERERNLEGAMQHAKLADVPTDKYLDITVVKPVEVRP